MRILDTWEYLDQARAMLAEGAASVPVPVVGTSMCPFLHPGDTVYLELPRRSLKKGDIVLFSREDGRYILHRIVGLVPEGEYLLLGDNQTRPEPVRPERIHAIAGAVCRNGKKLTPGSALWWFYAHPWRLLAPCRPRIAKIREIGKR